MAIAAACHGLSVPASPVLSGRYLLPILHFYLGSCFRGLRIKPIVRHAAAGNIRSCCNYPRHGFTATRVLFVVSCKAKIDELQACIIRKPCFICRYCLLTVHKLFLFTKARLLAWECLKTSSASITTASAAYTSGARMSDSSFGPSCPYGGEWYACGTGSMFTGCCALNPCQFKYFCKSSCLERNTGANHAVCSRAITCMDVLSGCSKATVHANDFPTFVLNRTSLLRCLVSGLMGICRTID